MAPNRIYHFPQSLLNYTTRSLKSLWFPSLHFVQSLKQVLYHNIFDILIVYFIYLNFATSRGGWVILQFNFTDLSW